MALQHLRSSTADKRPLPGSMADGQLALNSNATSPGLFFKDSAGALVKVGPVHVGTTAPNVSPATGGQAGNSKGEQWLDTTGGTYVFKVWDGTAWRSESGTFVDINGDTMTGALGIIAGSNSAPGLFFSGDTDTGIYSPGADQLTIATNGVPRLRINANGTATFAYSINSAEETITGSAFDLVAGNYWTCGAITVPAPTNAIAGTSGLIRITAGPVVWNAVFKFPGGTAPTIASFPAIIPFYVQNSTTILMGNVTEGIA